MFGDCLLAQGRLKDYVVMLPWGVFLRQHFYSVCTVLGDMNDSEECQV